MELKKVNYNQLFLLPGDECPFKLVMSKNSRNGSDGKEVYVAPFVENVLWVTRGRWVGWETEVSLVEMTPYEKVIVEAPVVEK